MGLMTAHSQKVDLNMAPGTKHCESTPPQLPYPTMPSSCWWEEGGGNWVAKELHCCTAGRA